MFLSVRGLTGLISWVLFLVSPVSPAYGQQSCFALFEPIAATAKSTRPPGPFHDLLSVLETGNGDAIQIIHSSVIEISRRPELHVEIPRYIEDLQFFKNRVANEQFSSVYNSQLAEKAVYLLRLITDKDLSLWHAILTHDQAMISLREFNSYGTMGYLLRELPQATKNELLVYLGQIYSIQKNRALIQPVHLLLDPKKIYDEFKAQGRSDRDFYEHYLWVIKTRVFSGLDVGGYSGETVLHVISLIQKHLLSSEVQAVNFFGSVPNGFGKPKSDLDIFNHPLPKNSSEADMIEFAKSFDLFGQNRHQVTHPDFEVGLGRLLEGTPWKWRSEDHGDSPPEHFGGERHVFSFHIQKDKVVLRFYHQKLKWDENAQPTRLHYMELDMGSIPSM